MDKKSLDKMAETIGGVPVYNLIKGWSSYNAGIRQGDIITSVNGVKTSSVDDYLNAIPFDRDGVRVIEVWRNNETLTFDVDVSGRSMTEEEVSKAMVESRVGEYLLSEKEIGQA